VRVVYGDGTLEENLAYIASALGNKCDTPRAVIRSYFLNDFYKDHCKVYQKRPIYWLFDSGKENGFKALVYMHRYGANTIGNLRIDYLHRMQRIYESEIARMQETIDNSTVQREITAATKRREKLVKQLKESKDYDEKIAHLALSRIMIDLDDGVKANYEKVQTSQNGKKLDILATI
jgi:type II restriction/modification system DNA methylase subunit YeeA